MPPVAPTIRLRRTRSTHRVRPCALIVLLVGALVVGACSGGGGAEDEATAASPQVPAVVGGGGIRREAVQADLAAEAEAAEAGRTAASQSALADPVGDDGDYTAEAKAAALTNRILDQIYAQTLEREAIGVSAADQATARETVCADPSTGQAPADGSCPPLEGYPAPYRTFTTRLVERQVAFGRNLHERAYATVEKSHPDLLEMVCVNLVQTADAATAERVRTAVAGGSSLGDAIATPVEDGTASASREGCLFVDDAPDDLQKANDGDVVAVSDEQLHYVAQVIRHKDATREEFTTQPPTSDTVRTIVDRQVASAVKALGVEVDDSWGTWDAKTFGVVPPGGESGATTTTSPSTVVPSPTTAPTPTTAPG